MAETYKYVASDYVDLELTRAEAEVLLQVLFHVGGDPAGKRGLIDRITDALDDAGVEYYSDPDSVFGGVVFVD